MPDNSDELVLVVSKSDQETLMGLIRRELVSIPVSHWGFFFPCHIAVWRFIEIKRPGSIGTLKATYRDEPCFEGAGSKWFCEVLGDNETYLNLLEAIMYPMTLDAATSARERVRQRGFFLDDELQPLDPEIVQQLAELVLKEVDEGISSGLIDSPRP